MTRSTTTWKVRAGFTLIELLIVIAVIAILAAIALPNLLQSRKSANETSAIGSLKVINGAEATYRSKNTGYGTLSQLASAHLIDPSLGAATASSSLRSNYYFLMPVLSTTQYCVVALPQSSSGGDHQFYTDEGDVLYTALAPPDVAAPITDSAGAAPAAAGWSQIGQ